MHLRSLALLPLATLIGCATVHPSAPPACGCHLDPNQTATHALLAGHARAQIFVATEAPALSAQIKAVTAILRDPTTPTKARIAAAKHQRLLADHVDHLITETHRQEVGVIRITTFSLYACQTAENPALPAMGVSTPAQCAALAIAWKEWQTDELHVWKALSEDIQHQRGEGEAAIALHAGDVPPPTFYHPPAEKAWSIFAPPTDAKL